MQIFTLQMKGLTAAQLGQVLYKVGQVTDVDIEINSVKKRKPAKKRTRSTEPNLAALDELESRKPTTQKVYLTGKVPTQGTKVERLIEAIARGEVANDTFAITTWCRTNGMAANTVHNLISNRYLTKDQEYGGGLSYGKKRA